MQQGTASIQGFRLSPPQRRLLPLISESPAAQCVLTLEGGLDAAGLRAALARVAERHTILRTRFPRALGQTQPVQVISDLAPAWRRLDLRGLPPRERRDRIDELLREEASSLDPAAGPSLRAVLTSFSARESALLLTLPALCADSRTFDILADELLGFYGGARPGEDEELVQYFQISEWLNQLLEGDDAEAGREFWRREQAAAGKAVTLPFEQPRQESGSLLARLDLGSALAAKIDKAARVQGASPAALMTAALGALLCRWGAASPLTVAVVVDGRKYDQLLAVPGPLSTCLPITCRFRAGSSLGEALDQVGASLEDAVNALEYSEWGNGQDGDPDPAAMPVGFELEEPPGRREAGGLAATVARQVLRRERFKLKLTCTRTAEGLAARIRARAELFRRTDLEHLLRHFAAVLERMVERPDQTLGDLPLLSAADRHRWLIELNDTGRGAAPADVFERRFAEQAAHAAEAVAVELGARKLTYGELSVASNRLAHYLRGLGVGPEVLVGVFLERRPEMVVALLGILKAGGAYLPLDPEDPAERRRLMLAEAGVSVVLTREALRTAAGGPHRTVCLDSEAPRISAESGREPGDPAAPDHLAYVIYTSGSTGRPKGTLIQRRGLVNYLSWAADTYPSSAGTPTPVHTSICFDLTVTSLLLPLMVGGRVALIPEESGPEGLAAALGEPRRWGLVKLTPSHLALLPRGGEDVAGRAAAFIFGGEALHGESLPPGLRRGTRLYNEYGPTETVVGCCIYEVARGGPSAGPVPIGRPIGNTRAHVLDGRLRPVPHDMAGCLFVGGEGLARGYLERPGLSAERFVPDGASRVPGQRLYDTGDRVRRDAEGQLSFLGRRDEQVKVRGFRVEPGEIEAVLASHPAVREAAVLAREDRLVAWYTAAESSPASPGELRAFLAARLPAYMIPATLASLPELPLARSGKVDRARLRELSPQEPRPAYVAPDDETEEVLAAIVGRVLEVDRVGVLDNVFALGGDSIRSVRIVAQAVERGLELTVSDLFEHQTVRQLARKLRSAPESAVREWRTELFSLVSPEDRARLPEGVEDAFPLTRLQAGMIYHMDRSAERPAFHNVNTSLLRGPFDAAALERAVALVVARHPALRTSFDLSSYSEPLQMVWREVEPHFVVEDLRRLPSAARRSALDEFWASENLRAFDLARPPLQRYTFHRLTDETFQFTLTEPHVILDGWSTTSTFNEIFECYRSLRKGEPPAPPEPLATTFRDYVVVERRERESEANRRFWEEKLRGTTLPRLPRFPARRPSRSEPVEVFVPEEVFRGLQRLARQEAVPLKSVLMLAHLKLLGLISGQRDVASVIATTGRLEVPDGTRVRGLFLNMLPLCLALGDGTWAELARRCFASERELMAFRRYPLAEIRKVWDQDDVLETGFNYLNFHSLDEVLGSDELEVLDDVDFSYANFTFGVNFTWFPRSERLRLRLEFDPAEIRRFQVLAYRNHFCRLLAAIAADPSARHEDFCALTPAERHQALREWNDSRREFPRDRSIRRVFEEVASRRPEATAARFGERSMSYGELNRQANKLAHHLLAMGLEAEERVGIFVERSLPMVVATLAVLKAGGAYLPLDLAYPAERLSFMLADAGVRLLLSRRALAGRLPEGGFRVLRLDADAPSWAAASARDPAARPGPEQLAYVIYTSGSTGRPKGVAVPQRGVVRLVVHSRYVVFRPGDRVAQLSNISFDAATFEIWGALLNGGCLVGLTHEVLLSPPELARAIRGLELDVMFMTPALFHEIAGLSPETFASLRDLVVGGDVVNPKWSRAVLAAAGLGSLVNGYGPTENTTFSISFPLGELAPEASSVPIGRPIENSRAHVVDREMHPLPVGSPGEILLGGDGLARGYLGRPAATAEKFLPDPLTGTAGSRLYASGDRGRYGTAGQVEFLGRFDDQVKIRGFRVEPGEITLALLRHPAVHEAVVRIHETGPGERRLIAYLVADSGAGVPGEELRGFLEGSLPPYMVPAVYVALEKMPLTPNGKIDVRALPAPEAHLPAPDRGDAEPRREVEEVLAAIWAQVLGRGRVRRDDNYFELGGDSILSLRVVALARERGLPLSIELLFRHPDIASLGEALEAAEAGDAAAGAELSPFDLVSEKDRARAERPEVEDAYPLTKIQLGMIYHQRLDPDAPPYHNVRSWHLSLPWRPALFQRAVDGLVERHPALRTSFELTGFSEPLQVVHGKARLTVAVDDLRGLPEQAADARLDGFVQEEYRRLFDLSRAPLMRLAVHLRSAGSFQLTMTECHAVTDGWSTTSNLAELFAGYLALVDGRPPAIAPPPSTSYRDLVWLERQALAAEASRTFWRERVAGVEALELPAWPRPPGTAPSRARCRHLEVPRPLLDGLRRLAHAEAVPVKSVLLAVHLRVLGWICGARRIATGLTTDVRPESRDAAEARGLFLNTLLFSFELGRGSWRRLVRQVFFEERTLQPHRRFPFAEVQGAWGRHLVLETNFNFVNFHSISAILQSDQVAVLDGGEKSLAFGDFPLGITFSLDPVSSQLRMELELDASRVGEAQSRLVLRHYLEALRAVARDPDEEYAARPLFSAAEEHQLRTEWNDTRVSGTVRPVPELFDEVAARFAGRPAVECGEDTLTFSQLDEHAGRWARALCSRGVGPDVLVAVGMEKGCEQVIALLAVLKAGGTYLPIDPAHPPERRAFLLRDSRAALVLARPGTDWDLPGVEAPVLRVDRSREPPAGSAGSPRALGLDLANTAYVIYTSGTTGTPKGVMTHHAGFSNMLAELAERFEVDEESRFLHFSSLTFDASLAEIGLCLTTGATLCVPRGDAALPGAGLSAYFRDREITHTILPPSALAKLSDEELPALGTIVVAGEACPLATIARWAPGRLFYNAYGPSEASVCTSMTPLGGEETWVTIGRPNRRTDTWVVDGRFRRVPAVVSGELVIGGLGLARGYLDRRSLSAEKFVPHPWSRQPGQRLYRSGDLVRHLADGAIDFRGRIDHQVKIRGIRVEPQEIEEVLGGHPDVLAAVVAARGGRLVAYWSPRRDPAPADAELRRFLSGRLPVHMVPEVFERLAGFPLLPSGKIDRRALPEPGAEERPRTPFVAPRNETEKAVAGIVREVLELDRVGIDDNFFDLGGNSLLLLRAHVRLQESLERTIPLAVLFEHSTVQTLARYLSDGEAPAPADDEGLETEPATARDRLRRQLRRSRQVGELDEELL